MRGLPPIPIVPQPNVDQASGAEVPAPEIAVSPAMTDAGYARLEDWIVRARVAPEELVVDIYREMERARRAEAHTIPPPGYRNASEDEPERSAGPRCAHGALLLIGPPCQACVAEVEAFRQN